MVFEFSKLLFFIITSVYTYVTIILHTRKHYGVRMETLLIQQNEKSNKFWKIVVKEKDYVVFYGKIGTAGSLKAKEFETEEECMKEANKLVASKRKKDIQTRSWGRLHKRKTITEEEFWELLNRAKRKVKTKKNK